MTTLRTFLAIVAIALFSANSAQGDTLTVGFYDWCPYTCDPKANEGKSGYIVELIEAAFEDSPFELEFRFLPYARILAELEKGTVHLVAGATKEESTTFLNPSKNQGYYSGGFFARKDERTFTGYESLAQLKRVAIIKGYEYNSPEFSKLSSNHPDKIKYVTGNHVYEKMFKMLNAGRIEAIHEDIKALQYYANKFGVNDSIGYWGGETKSAPIFTSFSPSSDLATRALVYFNSSFERLIQSGKLDEILNSYNIDPNKFNYDDI